MHTRHSLVEQACYSATSLKLAKFTRSCNVIFALRIPLRGACKFFFTVYGENKKSNRAAVGRLSLGQKPGVARGLNLASLSPHICGNYILYCLFIYE